MRTVLDVSAAANVVLRTDLAPDIIEKLERSQIVIAPTLYYSEIANTLWKYVRTGELDKDTALARYEEAIGLVDAFEADASLITEALSAAIRYNHPVYDLLYVILARRRGCKVLSADKKLLALAEKIDEDILP